jgi:hypothetical protein
MVSLRLRDDHSRANDSRHRSTIASRNATRVCSSPIGSFASRSTTASGCRPPYWRMLTSC